MRILMFGSGTAATSVVNAVTAARLGTVVAVVDPALSIRPWAQELAGVGAAYASAGDVPTDEGFDVVCVAVPTPLHRVVLGQVLQTPWCAPIVLSEKPLTTTATDTHAVRHLALASGISLRMLLHFSFAPEVTWLRGRIRDLAERLGPLRAVESYFADDYCLGDLDEAESRLGSPWLDSGVNSLSVVLHFVEIDHLVARDDNGHTSTSALFAGTRGEDISVVTTWDDATRQKWTRLTFENGLVIVDHKSGVVNVDGVVVCGPTVETARIPRYAPLMQKHLREAWTKEDEAYEQRVLSCLYAVPSSSA